MNEKIQRTLWTIRRTNNHEYLYVLCWKFNHIAGYLSEKPLFSIITNEKNQFNFMKENKSTQYALMKPKASNIIYLIDIKTEIKLGWIQKKTLGSLIGGSKWICNFLKISDKNE